MSVYSIFKTHYYYRVCVFLVSVAEETVPRCPLRAGGTLDFCHKQSQMAKINEANSGLDMERCAGTSQVGTRGAVVVSTAAPLLCAPGASWSEAGPDKARRASNLADRSVPPTELIGLALGGNGTSCQEEVWHLYSNEPCPGFTKAPLQCVVRTKPCTPLPSIGLRFHWEQPKSTLRPSSCQKI